MAQNAVVRSDGKGVFLTHQRLKIRPQGATRFQVGEVVRKQHHRNRKGGLHPAVTVYRPSPSGGPEETWYFEDTE